MPEPSTHPQRTVETEPTGSVDGGALPPAHHRPRRGRDAARRASSHDTVGLPLPGLGTVQLSRPQLAYVAGVVLLTAAELVLWPVGLALATGHLLAADRDSKTLEEFGDALEQA